MSKVYKRTPSAFLHAYNDNAVLQLIIACGVTYVLYHFTEVVLWLVGVPRADVSNYMLGNATMPSLTLYAHKWWTLLTYGWVHDSFWVLLSNMVWLYCFGSVVQSLVGYRQVIPLFIYALLIGGIFYLLSQLIPGMAVPKGAYVYGCPAGLTAMAAASITIAPKYRLFLGPTFSIPLWLIACVFAALMLLGAGLHVPLLLLLAGGALTGFAYIKILQRGYRPGAWMYNIFTKMEGAVTPNEMAVSGSRSKKRRQVLDHVHAHGEVSQKRIDDILDKINRHGYSSLSNEEKEILMKASKEN